MLDAPTATDCSNDDYYNYIKDVKKNNDMLDTFIKDLNKKKTTLSKIMFEDNSRLSKVVSEWATVSGADKDKKTFGYGEEMLGFNGVSSNFLLPQRDILGNCDNFKAPGFLRDVKHEACL